jgi:hypothetical protein
MAAKVFEYEIPDEKGFDWPAYRSRIVVRARQILEHESFSVGGEKGKEGDFIVVGPDKVEILSENELEARYEPCALQGGLN